MDIKSMTLEELKEELKGQGMPAVRATQVYQWMHQKLAPGFDEMTNLSKDLRAVLAEKYPEDHRPREAVGASRAWAAGEIKMPIAKQAILSCHAMAKELTNPADIARCHAVGQACSVVHTAGHALGYPMYALTAMVLEHGLDDCREPIEQRLMDYEQRIRYWMEYEKNCQQYWAGFLKK